MKNSNNKHLIDLIFNRPGKIKLDNRDTKESIIDFVCALKRKKIDFPDIHFTILGANQIPFKLVIKKTTKAMTEELGSHSKSENVILNTLYSRGRAAKSSVRILSQAS